MSRVSQALDVSEGTVFRIQRRFAEDGLEGALKDRGQAHRYWKLVGRGPSHRLGLQPGPRGPLPLGTAPAGGPGGGVGGGGVLVPRDGAAASEKNSLKPWQKKHWCIPKVSADFVAHMEDILDPYAEPYDPQRPVVCFDETSTQLLADVREALPAKPGNPRREDYEYRREGTRNLFLFCKPLVGWRHVEVTQRRTTEDFAHQMRWLVVQAYPDIPVVRLVLDNLNTHCKASLYQAFPAEEARRIAQRLEVHYTPKHGSWLNMAEIEFSIFSRSCLRQRLPDEESLFREVQALELERNQAQARINRRFGILDARTKLHRLYPIHP